MAQNIPPPPFGQPPVWPPNQIIPPGGQVPRYPPGYNDPPKTRQTSGGSPFAEGVSGPIDDCMRSVTVIAVAEEFSGTAPTTGNANIFVNGVPRGTMSGSVTNFQIPNPWGGPTQTISLFSVEVPITGCSLKVSDLVQSTVTINGVTSALSAGVRVESHLKYSCLTQHYNNARTGWYPHETQLTLALLQQGGANAFQQQFQLPVDGQPYAQPLYMHHVNFPGLGAKNVVFIATEKNNVYAYDADDPNAVLIWQRSLLLPGERAVKDSEAGCGDIRPFIGVSSTPIIDCACNGSCCDSQSGCGTGCGCEGNGNIATCCTQTMYIVSKSVSGLQGGKNGLKFHLYLHALDIITGAERPNSPVEIKGQVNGDGANSVNGIITFDPGIQNVRPGLLLLDGCIYIGSASHCDHDLYHGWVFSYDAKTLRQRGIFCTTPDGPDALYDFPSPQNTGWGGGIWQGGQGLATDGESIYCTTGNGGGNPIPHGEVIFSFNANVGGNNYGNSVLKLGKNLKLQSYFTPADQWQLDNGDVDLGSGGVMILPPQLGSSPNQLVTMGKDGMIFLLDRDEMGGFAGDATHGQYGVNSNTVFTIGSSKDTINPTDGVTSAGGGIWGGPAFYNGVDAQTIFYGEASGPITAFNILNGVLTRQGTTSINYQNDGTTPVVTSNHQLPTTQLVWAIIRNLGGNTALTVYDAISLQNGTKGLIPVINPPLIIGPWTGGEAFIVPTIVNGKVYAACESHIGVFFCANEQKVS